MKTGLRFFVLSLVLMAWIGVRADAMQVSTEWLTNVMHDLRVQKYDTDLIVEQLRRSGVQFDSYEFQQAVFSVQPPFSQQEYESLKANLKTNLAVMPNVRIDYSGTNKMLVASNQIPAMGGTESLKLASDYERSLIEKIQLANPAEMPEFKNYTNALEAQAASLGNYYEQLTKSDKYSVHALFSSGAEFLNPFVVSVPNPTPYGFGTLTNSGGSTVGYLQFDVMHKHILDPVRGDDRYCDCQPSWWRDPFDGYGVNPFKSKFDWHFKVGTIIQDGSNLTNTSYSAQTVASSDFYSQFELGLPIWRRNPTRTAQQISIVLSGGVATEKNFDVVHPNLFLGAAFESSFQPSLFWHAPTNMPGFFIAKFGISRMEIPDLTGVANQVRLDGNGLPEFRMIASPTMTAYLAWPLSDSVYLTFEGNTYYDDIRPNSWNIKVGASISFDKISGLVSDIVK